MTCTCRGAKSQLAAQVYPALVTLHPTDVHLRTKLATLLLDLGEVDGALEQYLNLADMLFNNGQHERAWKNCAACARLAPQNPEVRLHKGTYLLRMDRPAEALAEFGRALQLDSDNMPALVRTYITLVMLDRDTQWDALQTVLVEARDGGEARDHRRGSPQLRPDHRAPGPVLCPRLAL